MGSRFLRLSSFGYPWRLTTGHRSISFVGSTVYLCLEFLWNRGCDRFGGTRKEQVWNCIDSVDVRHHGGSTVVVGCGPGGWASAASGSFLPLLPDLT